MRTTRAATLIHKWLALLMALQMLFWFASGLFFAAVPIERVRSEHRIVAPAAASLPLELVAVGVERLGSRGIVADRIEIGSLLGRPATVLRFGKERPRLYDLATGERLSPIAARMAGEIARLDSAPAERVTAIVSIAAPSAEYRGALPAWRVEFEDGYAVYVAADTGAVTARRSTVWRVYDWLWALHIMDFRDHEDFNSPLLIVAAALGLVIAVSGVVMLPARLRRAKKTGQ